MFFFSKKYWISWKKIGEGVLKDLKKTDDEDALEQQRKRDKKKKKRDVGDLMNDYQDDLNFDK